MNNTITLNEAGSVLLGAGLVQIGTNLNLGLSLVGIGASLKVVIAILDKYGVEVGSKPQQ